MLVKRIAEYTHMKPALTLTGILQPTSPTGLHAMRLAGKLHNLHHTSPTVYLLTY